MSDRYASLAPRDIVITLRSFPRRFGEIGGAVRSDGDLLALVDLPGADGTSLRERIDAAARTLALLTLETHRTLTNDSPVLSPGAGPHAERDWSDQEQLTLTDAVDLLSGEADSLASELDGAEMDEWNRTAKVAGSGETVTVTELAQEAVRSVVDELYAAEEQLAHLRQLVADQRSG